MFGLGVLVCLSVGYGFGTLVQFDHDWREAPPALVASVEGSLAQGEPIEQAIEDLLAGSHDAGLRGAVPEPRWTSWATSSCAGPGRRSGMVSVVASESAGPPDACRCYGPA